MQLEIYTSHVNAANVLTLNNRGHSNNEGHTEQ